MKQGILVLILLSLLASCKKDHAPNSADLCFTTSFISSNIQDDLIAVFFQNGRTGFVAGSHGGIYKTTDSAQSWTALNSNTTLPIRDIYFTTPEIGFAVGGENSCSGTGCTPPGGFILRTQDGGQNWNQIFTPVNKLEITSIYFVNDQLGFCVGDNVIYKTIDGGQSWTENPVSNLGGKMMKVRFADSQNGFIVCLFDKILKTSDGGNSWQLTSPNKNLGYYAVASSNGATYVSGQGRILKSVNNGVNWNELPNSPRDIYDLHFVSQNIGFAFGRGNYSGGDFGRSYGAIYCTVNGGFSWKGNGDFQEVGLIKAVSFPSGNLGYAVSGNKIIKIMAN